VLPDGSTELVEVGGVASLAIEGGQGDDEAM
jgi:hypothetical protein